MQGQEKRREETTVQHLPAQSGDVRKKETNISTSSEVRSFCYCCQTLDPCPISKKKVSVLSTSGKEC